MRDWHQYWNTAPRSVSTSDHRQQVGKTVNGRPVEEATLDAMAADIAGALKLRPDDRLLDLCCGNGMITVRCAAHCEHVTGVDFSEPLIRVAKSDFARDNIEYILGDVLRPPPEITQRLFSKVCMYEALQNFTTDEVGELLVTLRQSGAQTAPLFLGSVPDRDRIWAFYDTPERRNDYHRGVKEGTEAIGHWWTASELTLVAGNRGYLVRILNPNATLHVAHYRFDALLTPHAGSTTKA